MPRFTTAALALSAAIAAGAPALAAGPVVPPSQTDAGTVPPAPQQPSLYGYRWTWLPPAPDRPTAAARATRWYGYQTLLVDAASAGVMLAGTGARQFGTVTAVGLGAYALGGPVVHAVHGHLDKAALDLGLRVVLPMGIGATLAATTCSRPDTAGGDGDSCRMTSVVAGLALGVPIAMLIDSTVIAREPVPTGPTVAIAPMIDDTRRGVAVTGTF